MPEVRLIDANALIKDIAESIRLADEWEKEAREKEDEHGIKCAIDTRRALRAMISRVKEAPTIETEPVRHGRWIKQENGSNLCSICGVTKVSHLPFCGHCGAQMDETDTNVGGKGGDDNDT